MTAQQLQKYKQAQKEAIYSIMEYHCTEIKVYCGIELDGILTSEGLEKFKTCSDIEEFIQENEQSVFNGEHDNLFNIEDLIEQLLIDFSYDSDGITDELIYWTAFLSGYKNGVAENALATED